MAVPFDIVRFLSLGGKALPDDEIGDGFSFKESERDFYNAYGLTLGMWASVERSLGKLFAKMTRLDQKLAFAIFYSAKSFRARADMVQSCVPLVKVLPFGRRFLARLVNRTKTYSEGRNSLAHDQHILVLEPKGAAPIHKVILSPDGTRLSITEIERLGQNFLWLSLLIDDCQGEHTLIREPELCLEMLDELPADPLARGVNPQRAMQLRSRIGQSSD